MRWFALTPLTAVYLARYLFAALWLASLSPLCLAQEKLMRLASLEWAPYVGQNLPQFGLSSAIISSAAQKFGMQTRIEYFPWKRAMQLGGKDASYVGYFPAYYTKERAQECYFSQPIGASRVGLAYLKNNPLQFESVNDLAAQTKLTIGVVYGYSNGDEFDVLVKQGRLKTEASASDGLNLRKLMIGRVHAAVVDEVVLRYLLKTDPMLSNYANQIAFHPHPLADLNLYVCFQMNSQGLEMKNALDRALQEMNLRKFEEDYFAKLPAAAPTK